MSFFPIHVFFTVVSSLEQANILFYLHTGSDSPIIRVRWRVTRVLELRSPSSHIVFFQESFKTKQNVSDRACSLWLPTFLKPIERAIKLVPHWIWSTTLKLLSPYKKLEGKHLDCASFKLPTLSFLKYFWRHIIIHFFEFFSSTSKHKFNVIFIPVFIRIG